MNPWNENMLRSILQAKMLILLPREIENATDCIRTNSVVVKVCQGSEYIEEECLMGEVSAVFLFNPTEYAAPHRWSMAWLYLLRAVIFGTELTALPGPQGEHECRHAMESLQKMSEETVSRKPHSTQKLKRHPATKLGLLTKSDSYTTVTDAKSECMQCYAVSVAKRFWDTTRMRFAGQYQMPFLCRRDSLRRNTKNYCDRNFHKKRMTVKAPFCKSPMRFKRGSHVDIDRDRGKTYHHHSTPRREDCHQKLRTENAYNSLCYFRPY
ncbi:hypothetical protein Aduo_002332 [Ancylostoma duodenale]